MPRPLINRFRQNIATAQQMLAAIGICDRFIVKVRPFTGDKARLLGLYRAASQFKGGPIIWVNEANDSLVRDTIPDADRRPWLFDKIWVDTVLHEYGHVIWEFAEREPCLFAHLRNRWTDCEDFAESFARYARSGLRANDFYPLVSAYARAALGATNACMESTAETFRTATAAGRNAA